MSKIKYENQDYYAKLYGYETRRFGTDSYVFTTSTNGSFTTPYYEQINFSPEPAVPVHPPKKKNSDKGNKDMASTAFTYNEREEIDAAVREAIVAPRKAAEIATRIAAVQALGSDESYEVGTVLTFSREISGKTYPHVAIKSDQNKWFIGGGAYASGSPRTFEDMVAVLTTGDQPILSEVKVATEFRDITWDVTTPASVIPSQVPATV